MQTWEYGHLILTSTEKFIWGHKYEVQWDRRNVDSKDFDIYAFINSLGKQGWDLVSTWAIHHEGGRDATVVTYVFKRPREALAKTEQQINPSASIKTPVAQTPRRCPDCGTEAPRHVEYCPKCSARL